MNFFHLLSSCFLALTLAFPFSGTAQCVPDTLFNVPGMYPDTLAYGCKGVPYSAVINFVFPPDTTLTTPPITVPFDSFIVSSVVGLPPGLGFSCNAASCLYITNPPNLTHGCVNIFGTPTDTTMFIDSVEVTGDAYIKIFNQIISFPSVFKLGIKIYGDSSKCLVGIDENLQSRTSVYVFPNPQGKGSIVKYSLSAPAQVNLELYNIFGQKVKDLYRGYLPQGSHKHNLNEESLPAGMFFVKLSLDRGKAVLTKKILVVH